MKTLKVHNTDNLPTIAYSKLIDFQGDLKHQIEPRELEKMRNSLKKHGVFVPKFVWFDESGKANIMDGHQTKQALKSLEADGWKIPEIPYVTVEANGRKDAAEKLLQINSRYAKMNPNTTWLEEFDFDLDEIEGLIDSIEIPELKDIVYRGIDIEIIGDTSTERDGQGVSSTWSQVDKAKTTRLIIGDIETRIENNIAQRLICYLKNKFESVGDPIHKTIQGLIENALKNCNY